MPAPVSKKQARYMYAILNSKHGTSSRGDRVPNSVAGKYVSADKKKKKDQKETHDVDLPESKGKEHDGGTWGEEHHGKDKQRVDAKRQEKKKEKSEKHIKKSLEEMIADEDLSKNIVRSEVGSDVVHEVTHGDALRLVGNGTFRFLRRVTKDMKDEDFKDVDIDNYKMSLRRHAADVYSGRINDGHKLVHQWTNRSLPQMAAELMSVFEWYSPEDEEFLEEIGEDALPDHEIHGGLNGLLDNYKKHNIANIYTEMENIRTEIRNGAAVDLQQIEQRIMKLFDKLEAKLLDHSDKHNKLANSAGDEIDKLHEKLLELQSKIDSLGKKPTSVEAFSTNPANPAAVHNDSYMYLSKPQVTIHPDGRIQISFGGDWATMERENFLNDMRAKALKKAKK